tara:strand:+ start:37 stop:735 length:699 start_codon:yes stop_codon:yes gene_type:complete
MAVNVDTVYQRVLALANKEQRGYITPQEFNLLANQAQQEIFEQYFYDLNHRDRLEPEKPGVRGEEDIMELLDKKMAVHTIISTVIGGTIYPDNYAIGKVFVNGFEAEKLPRNEVLQIGESTRHLSAIEKSPVYCDSGVNNQDIYVLDNNGQAINGVTCEVITKPHTVRWDYVVVGQKALYNSANSVDFDMHESEETNLVDKISMLAGIVMNKSGYSQTFSTKETTELTSKKQ